MSRHALSADGGNPPSDHPKFTHPIYDTRADRLRANLKVQEILIFYLLHNTLSENDRVLLDHFLDARFLEIEEDTDALWPEVKS